MLKSESIHSSELGWFVSLETKINELKIGAKSAILIILVGLLVTYAASFVSVFIGMIRINANGHFLWQFVKLSWATMKDWDYNHLTWLKTGQIILHDFEKLFIWHAWIGVIAAYFFLEYTKKKSKEMEKTEYIKGSKIISEIRRIEDIKEKIVNGQLKSRVDIGRIPMPVESEVEHFICVAATRGGKGVLLSKILIGLLLDPNCKAFLHDRKPEWAEKFFRPERDLIFNPMDKRSIKWTIWNDIKDSIDIKAFANYIVPPNPEAKEPFWQNSARGILEGILFYLWAKRELTNAAIREIIKLPGEEISELIKGHEGSEYALKPDSLSTLRTQMVWVDFLADGEFSIRDWVINGTGILFLLNPQRTNALFRPILTFFTNVVGSTILELEDDRNRRINFIIDEATALDRLSCIMDLTTMGASKGAPLWLFFQDIQRFEKIYSKEDFKTVMNNCKNVAIGQIKEPDAAEYLSKRFGKMEFYENTRTSSMGSTDNKDGQSLNFQRKEDFVVKATDLINLQKRQFYVMIEGYEGVTQTTADIQHLEKVAEDFVPIEMSVEEQLALVMPHGLSNRKRKFKNEDGDVELTSQEIRDEIEQIRDFF